MENDLKCMKLDFEKSTKERLTIISNLVTKKNRKKNK